MLSKIDAGDPIEPGGFPSLLVMLMSLAVGCVEGPRTEERAVGLGVGNGGEIPLKTAKLLIEHNATAEDTGFQGFLDGEPWEHVALVGPRGTQLTIDARRGLSGLGLTELFFETNEPENAEVPIEDVLAVLPEGEYEYEARTVDGEPMEGAVTLTHAIPAGPVITSPLEGATVDPGNLTITWNAVTQTIDGSSVEIAGYEIIVEKDLEALGLLPPANGFSKLVLSAHVSAQTTSLTVPPQFLEPGTPYVFEVLALEKSGNQTLSSSAFDTL